MARKKDEIQMELAKVIKSARTAIRLKHSLAADAELNTRLPEIEAEFYDAVNKGRRLKLESIAL